eukprot:COSAG02_NODE_3443_length_6730_cov_33.609109_3_plen_72_part_00
MHRHPSALRTSMSSMQATVMRRRVTTTSSVPARRGVTPGIRPYARCHIPRTTLLYCIMGSTMHVGLGYLVT